MKSLLILGDNHIEAFATENQRAYINFQCDGSSQKFRSLERFDKLCIAVPNLIGLEAMYLRLCSYCQEEDLSRIQFPITLKHLVICLCDTGIKAMSVLIPDFSVNKYKEEIQNSLKLPFGCELHIDFDYKKLDDKYVQIISSIPQTENYGTTSALFQFVNNIKEEVYFYKGI